MRETSKLTESRRNRGYGAYFVGHGIDIGYGEDPLHSKAFPGILSVDCYDKADGDAQKCAGIKNETYEFVYSSHCLEHLRDPREAFTNWIRVCRVGGCLIIAVPHECFYEKYHWPSRFNGEHKTSWSHEWRSNMPNSIHLPDFVQEFHDVELIRMETVLDGFDFTHFHNDQTLGKASAQIDFVVRRIQ